MRFIKTLGLAAVAAVAAMAFIGATSASALNTQLCNSHGALTCGSAATSVSMNNAHDGVGTLLSDLVDVLCLNIETTATALALANPQVIHVTSLVFEGCGTKASHENCEVEVKELPLANLKKTGLDAGSVELTNGRAFLLCENVDIFGTDIECEYDGTGLTFSVGAQHLTAFETPVTETGSDFLCPNNPTLDGLLHTTAKSTPATILCKTHSKPCAEKDQAKSIDMTTTKTPVLYNTVANVECESSLTAATVLGPAEPQKLDVTTMSWKECHTQGAAENCTVTTSSLPTIDLEATALNLGSAESLGLKIEVDCLILDLIELDCTYDSDVTLGVEGALHKEGSGHGRFTSAKTVLELAEGGGHCPDEMKWDASYEASEHLYVVPSSSESGSNAYILA
jgi:hypothetical protein